MLRNRARPNRLRCRIECSGLAAILLTLFAGAALPQPIICRVYVTLPYAIHTVYFPEDLQDDALEISVLRDGKVFLDTTSLTPEELREKLRERVANGAPHTVYIRADAHVLYQAVMTALDSVRSAGLNDVVFLTSPKR